MGYFWGFGQVRKLFLGLNIQIENFHFLIIPLSCIFNVNPISGHFWPFGAVFGQFWVGVGQKMGCIGLFFGVWLGKKTVLESQYSD